ncbi:hypothetical protein EJ03DRAFT_386861 [Teratosphaeria nubilosa]|uniref:Ubiquitination network signaling protein n=1 Tax=Teratosphaeria nubilosa TaxID=161662 RepID=A0A6G1LN01_9PEZI|nr:hypothetical protein EJ03DRAFT_386861 [Teratosphaeria nubilosa]
MDALKLFLQSDSRFLNKHASANRSTEGNLAAPGKTVTRRADGQQGSQPNGKAPHPAAPASASVPVPALPATGLHSGLRFSRDDAPGSVALAAKDHHHHHHHHAHGLERTERDRTASEASVEEALLGVEMADNVNDAAASPINETPPTCSKRHLSRSGSSLTTVATILSYYPLRDAISILILLLSLPPTLVLVIQTLFTSLTFVPPTAGISTLPNLKELFNTSHVAYPALATILIIDLIFWACWLPLWKPVQSVFLDFSQVVIAISLSGAAATTGGPTHSIVSCTLIVCVMHVLRYKAIHLTALDYLRSVLHNLDIGFKLDAPPFAASFLSPSSVERGWFYTVFRTILGIHIVSQGVTTCIRRSLVKANERDQSIPAIIKTDTEATAGTEPTARVSNGAPEGSSQSYAGSSSDGRPPGQPPSQRDGKSRESTSKKKKKQANQVRSQQPLWAAIASTKVTFVKEMEQRDAADDMREASAMDTNNKPVFASTILSSNNRIWISEVRDTEVFFSVDLSPEAAVKTCSNVEEGVGVSAAIDKSKPFYVRVNGAAWSSTRIMSSATGDEADGRPRFDGEIFGLAPLSSYHCEVVCIGSGAVLCSISLITQAAPSKEQAASAPSQPQHPALRPSSPLTTLRQSIQSAEAKLNETRNRTRKTKKDQRGIHSDIRKEINSLRSKLETSGGLDDKQERRLAQINQHKTQAEEATAELKLQIEAFGDIPSDEIAEAEVKRRAWQAAADQKRAADKDLENSKAETERELTALRNDISAAESKREKLVARRDQRSRELESLLSKQQADMTAKQKRDFERAQIIQTREQEESQLRFHIDNMVAETAGYEAKSGELFQQLAALQNWNTAPPPYPGHSSPPTPESALTNANGTLSPQANGFGSMGPQPYGSPFQPTSQPVNPYAPRGRSSSMLSQYSGFTDDGEHLYSYPGQQYAWPMHAPVGSGAGLLDDRKESESGGSGSLKNGSTGSNSPRPDAKPFIPAGNKVITPIGPPSKTNKVPPSPGAIGSGR